MNHYFFLQSMLFPFMNFQHFLKTFAILNAFLLIDTMFTVGRDVEFRLASKQLAMA